MASTVLNVLHEMLSPRRPYCQLPPLIYLDIGFATGVPAARLQIQMIKTQHEDPLVKNFVQLCSSDKEGYKNSPVEMLDKLHGLVILGEVVCGQRNGLGSVSLSKLTQKPQEVPEGSVMMLPRAEDASQFNSVFYITTQKQTIHEGELIGQVEKGLSQLKHLVQDFGTNHGERPRKTCYVQDCGQI